MPPLAPPPQLVIPTAAAAANGFQNGQKGGNHHPQQPVLINAMAAITIASFFMTAPENIQNLPCGLPGDCCRCSTVKGKVASPPSCSHATRRGGRGQHREAPKFATQDLIRP